MNPILKRLGAVCALAVAVVSAAHAQVNQSDFIIAGVSTSPWNGNFSPGGTGGRGGVGGGIPANVVASVNGSLNGGSINSPISGGAVTGAPATNLGALMGGSPAGVNGVTSALSGAGAPSALVVALVQALNGLGNNPTPAAVIAAAQAFNALVGNPGTPTSALNNPQTLAIHAALTALLAGISS